MQRTLGVIGLGRMGYRTVLAGRQAGLKPVALLDRDPRPWALEQEPELASIATTDMEEFWRHRPDVVTISTPATHHVALLEEALQRGVRHILVEKPLACSVREAEKALELAERHPEARIAVNHAKRLSPDFRRMRALSGTPEMGELKAIYVSTGCAGYAGVGTHYFDLFNWMFDALPERLSAVGTVPEAPNPRGAHLDDKGGAILLEYPGSRRALVEMGDDVGVIGGLEFRYEFGRILMDTEGTPPRLFRRKEEFRNHPKSFYGAPLEEVPW